MKCSNCPAYIAEVCNKAQDGMISEIEDIECLLRVQISLLRGTWESLQEEEDWKI